MIILASVETVRNRAPVGLTIQIDDANIDTGSGRLPIEVVIRYPIDPPASNTTTLQIEANILDRSILLPNISAIAATPLVLCLASCGVSAIIGPLMRCLSQGGDINQILECLLAEGINISTSAVTCAIGCFTSGTPS